MSFYNAQCINTCRKTIYEIVLQNIIETKPN